MPTKHHLTVEMRSVQVAILRAFREKSGRPTLALDDWRRELHGGALPNGRDTAQRRLAECRMMLAEFPEGLTLPAYARGILAQMVSNGLPELEVTPTASEET